MQDLRLMLIATLTLGILMNYPSAAYSPVVTETPHGGMSREALERAYIESYEQSGFRLASSKKYSNQYGSWSTVLEFQLESAPEALGAPGTTLVISGSNAPRCQLCNLSRETFRAPDEHSSDPAIFARGQRVLIKADTDALAKVRKRLGVSLPAMDMPTP
ncbi:hypothetical protein [Xanthomonas hortorum]|uniref:hypothetical protein n=1 Tax=Xanthomonas hortorum TaxID=56454 RepID=UPI001592C002|nr:hypothetical protein [Xanthomonas hortorum]NHF64477.1 hypothetical protein [Xanthomonas hortorum]